MKEQRERLIELLKSKPYGYSSYEDFADYLLAEGVIAPPKKTSQEELWKKNAERLRCGGFGSLHGEEYYDTMLRYWKAQEQTGYPYASINVKCFELLIEGRSKTMTKIQKIWLEEIIDEHRVAAGNERLWAKGADTSWQARMHENNAEEHMEFADMLQTLLEDERSK